MDRRTKIRAVSFGLALVAVLTAWGVIGSVKAKRYRAMLAVTQQRALTQMCEYLDAMETDLQKASYAASPVMLASLSADLQALSRGAKNSLSALFAGDTQQSMTYKFFSQAGEYTAALSRKAGAGAAITREERETLGRLLEYATALSEQFDYMAQLAQANEFSFEMKTPDAGEPDEKNETVYYADACADAENGMAEFPTLLYDGPYSDTLLNRTSLLISQSPQISADEAKKKAADILGVSAKTLIAEGDARGALPVYRYYADDMHVAVTKNGGYLAYILSDRAGAEQTLTTEDAVNAAALFLEKAGYEGMTSSYAFTENGVCTVSFVYETGGYRCYPDMIKVSVSVTDGKVVGMDARDYLMNHVPRTPPEANVTQAEAMAALSPALQVKSVKRAVIPTAGGQEKYAYEFLCSDANGQDVLVYVDVETGAEDDILLLLYSDGGALTK